MSADSHVRWTGLGTDVSLSSSGAWSAGPSVSWQLGRWSLSRDVLAFQRSQEITRGTSSVRIKLAWVTDVSMSPRKFIATRKACARISYRPGPGVMVRQAWLLVGRMGLWESELRRRIREARYRYASRQRHMSTVDVVELTGRLSDVSERAAELLDLLCVRQSASTAELLDVCGCGQAELACMLSEDMNDIEALLGAPPVAAAINGNAVVRDAAWALDCRVVAVWEALRFPVDVYAEGDITTVVVGMPTYVVPSAVDVVLTDDRSGLVIRAGDRFSRWVGLATTGSAVSWRLDEAGMLVIHVVLRDRCCSSVKVLP